MAALLALAGGAQALPQGATVVAGQAAVQTPTPQLQVVTQGTPQAIIDWKSFSIAAGEKVRFDQPSAGAVLLNRVIGYDPTAIFGQMQANGRIFLLNPYGVIFGAGARIDVGGLVASSLSLANADFLAGRYTLTADDPAAPALRGAVRNEGTLNAPGGTVALVAPEVANTGSITADGGRVGLAATRRVSVDVEGDGLIFFQTSASDARTRLEQLGSIRADGGSVELRAAARGAFADTVLNLEGVVRAHSLGMREGRVVIDGGEAGITRVAGVVDVSGLGAGERGGQVKVTGYDVLLDNGGRVDARGATGGGTVLVGGNWQGQGSEPRADQTIVNPDASIDVSATGAGDGGTAVVWADYRTQYLGAIAARGGAQGGAGGKVETSGRQVLQALGRVDVSAPAGKGGTWLLDPNDITIKNNLGSSTNIDGSFTSTDDSAIVDAGQLGSNLVGNANIVVTTGNGGTSAQTGNITVQDAVVASSLLPGQTSNLTLRAQRNIAFTGGTISAGTGSLNLSLQAGTDILTNTPGVNASTITMDAASSINTGPGGSLNAIAKGAVTLGSLAVGGPLSVTGTAIAQTAGGITVGGNAAFDAGTGSIALASATTNDFTSLTLKATGASVAVTDANALVLSAPTLGANTAFSAAAATTLTLPTAAIATGTGNIDLRSNGGTLATAGALTTTTGSITLVGSSGLTVGHAVTSTSGPVVLTGGGAGGVAVTTAATVNAGSGAITATAAAGPIQLNGGTLATTGHLSLNGVGVSQSNTGTLTVGGTTDVTAGTGAIDLQSPTNAFTGAVSLDASGTLAAVRGSGDLQVGTLTLGSDTGLTAIAGGTLSGLSGALNRGTGGIDLRSLGGTLSTPGNLTTSNAPITLVGGTGLTVGNNLDSNGGAITLQGGPGGGVVVGNGRSIDAGGGTLTLDGGAAAIQLNNAGLSSTSSSPSAVTVRHGTTVTLGNVTANNGTFVIGVGGDVTGAVTQTNGTTVSAKTLAANTTGSITLGTGGANLTITTLGPAASGNLTLDDGGTLTIAGPVAATAGSNVDITSGGLMTVAGDVTVGGGGTLSLKGGGITQTAGSVVTGSTATLDAGGNSIDAQSAGNQFGGAVTLKAGGTRAAIRGTGALALANPTLGANTDLTAIAGGTLTLPATIPSTGGDLDLRSNGGTLVTAGSLSARSIALTGRDGITIGHNLTASAGVTLTTTNSAITESVGATINASAASSFGAGSGTVDLGQGNRFTSIGGTGGAVTLGEASSGGLALDAITATSLTVTTSSAGADVTQNAALAISGATLITTTNGGNVTLANTGNTFGTFGASAPGGGTVSVAAGTDLALDAVTATALTVNTSNGSRAVTQNAALAISGLATVNAGTGSVTLGNPGNALGSFAATAGAVSLREGSGVALDNVTAASLAVDTSGANGAITQVGSKTLAITGAVALNAGTGTVSIGNSGNTFGSVGATGGTVTLRAANIALDATTATTLTLDTSTTNGTITQNGAAVVTGLTTVNAGTGDVTLTNASNDFSNAQGVSVTGGAVRLRDLNALFIAALSQGANKDLSLTAGTTLSGLSGDIDTGGANLTLAAGTSFTTFGTLRGTNVSITGTGGISLGHDVTALGTLALTTTDNAIDQTAGHITATGITTLTAGTGTVTLTRATNDFGTVAVVSGSTVAIHDSNNVAVSAAASGPLTLDATGTLSSSGAISGTNVSLHGTTGITLGHDVTATGTLQLSSTNTAITQTGGVITAPLGLTTVAAGSGDITLMQAGNDFSDLFGIAASGGAVRLADTNALTIANLSVGLNKDLILSAGTTLTGVSGNIDTGAGNLTLGAGAGLTTFGTLRGTHITLAGGTGGVAIGHTVTALGDLTLTAANAPITQTAGTITSAGTTTASAGSGGITLNLAGNDFNAFSASGGAVVVRDANAIALGPVSATSLAVDTTAGNGAISSAGPVTVSGTTTLDAGTGAITLSNAGNDFATVTVTGGAVSVTDRNAIVLTGVNAASLGIDTSAGSGTVTQAAPVMVSGAVSVNAGTGNVTFTTPGNAFGSFGATGSTVTLVQAGPVVLGAISATTLGIDTSAANGAISQSAAATVGGTATVAAGSGPIALTHAGNHFGTIVASGGSVSITAADALTLGGISAGSLAVNTSAGNGAVTQSGAAFVSGIASVDAGSGAITLTQAGNDFGTVAATGGAVSIRDANALVLGALTASSLTVDTSAGSGTVTQSGNATVSGATTVNAGGGAVALTRPGNDFATLGVTGGAVSIVDANALTLTALTSGINQAVSVTAGGALTLPASAIDTGTASLALTGGGPLVTVGTLRGTTVSLGGAGPITIANDITALGSLSLTTAGTSITQAGGRIVSAGSTTVDAVTGDVQLAQAANDFQGGLGLRGGALDVRDSNDLVVASLVAAPNRPVTLRAGGSLVLPAAAIDTGSADLTLQALGGALVVNGALNGNNVTLTGATGLTIGADISSSGSQIYTSEVTLGTDVTLDAGANRVDLQGGVAGAGHDLALKSSNAAPDAVHTGAAVTNVVRFSITGNATIGGNVASSGNQTYAGNVTLGANVALDAGTAKIALRGNVDAVGHALALTSTSPAADAIRADGAIANASGLDVAGLSTFATGVSTTGAQVYGNTVTLGGAAIFSGTSLTFANGIAGGGSDVVLRADALSLAGAVAGSGNATLAPFSAGRTIGVAGGAGSLSIPQATLDAFGAFASLTIGRPDGTGDLTFGNLVLPTNLAATSASGNVTFTGTVASAAAQARNLTVTTGALTTFSGDVGGPIGGSQVLGQLAVAGATNLGANVTTAGGQTYGGALVVGSDATLSGGAVHAQGTLSIDTHAVTILADGVAVAGPTTGAGGSSLRVAPRDANGTLGIAGGAGTLQISQALVDTLAGAPTLILGRSDGIAAVSVGNLVLAGNLAVASGSGNITFDGTIDSAAGPARNLAVTTAGTTAFDASVGAARPPGTVTVAGPVQLGASVASTGAQTYGGAATLVADPVLSASSVAFATTVDGAQALVVNAAGTTTFGGAVGASVPLASLATDAAGSTRLGGNVTTTGTQRYDDALRLNADAVLTGSTLALAGRVDGAQSLTLNGASGTSLGQPVGAATPLVALTTSGPLQLGAGSVTTSGAQVYGGAVLLGAATTLSGSAVTFARTLDGAFALALPSAGLATFGADVGATTRLASLTAPGPVSLNGSGILTAGPQTYGSTVQVAGDARFSAGSLAFGGAVSGAHDLTLEANALTVAAGLAGTGTLAIAPLDPALAIGIAGGAGALRVAQSTLDGASGFTRHVIGRTDGTGAVDAGALQLRADTTLQSGSGDVRLGGSVDGAFDLALNTGGTTRIAGPVGATTALRSLTTDNNGNAADFDGTNGERTLFDAVDATGRARVITTGAQTYGDPVVAVVPIRFVGTTIKAEQPASRFDAGVAATADTLQLRSATDLRVDDVTLANGGRIETEGVLQIAGALRLDGGTLTLVSNATPTGVPFTDPELQGRALTVGFIPLDEASATILQSAGSTVASATGTLLVLRSPHGGTVQLDQTGNVLQGGVSAVSGTLGDNDTTRFQTGTHVTLGFVRLASSEIHVAGAPPADGSQAAAPAGVEGDVVKLSTDLLTTGTDGQIRARLPFNNVQGSQTSVPALTLVLGPAALLANGSFGSGTPDTFLQVRLGADDGGFMTVRPKAAGQEHFVFLGGPALIKPFYDGSGKVTEIRVFYNGDAPRTPQETGALAAVTAVIEEARQARFEEAVRTENVSSRLRSGVIAEVGAGRPATVGREGIRRPDTCDMKPNMLRCE